MSLLKRLSLHSLVFPFRVRLPRLDVINIWRSRSSSSGFNFHTLCQQYCAQMRFSIRVANHASFPLIYGPISVVPSLFPQPAAFTYLSGSPAEPSTPSTIPPPRLRVSSAWRSRSSYFSFTFHTAFQRCWAPVYIFNWYVSFILWLHKFHSTSSSTSIFTLSTRKSLIIRRQHHMSNACVRLSVYIFSLLTTWCTCTPHRYFIELFPHFRRNSLWC